jgi:hypothetical protein
MVTAAELDESPRTVYDDKDGAADKIAYDQFAWFPPESRRRRRRRRRGGAPTDQRRVLRVGQLRPRRRSEQGLQDLRPLTPIWLELSVRE